MLSISGRIFPRLAFAPALLVAGSPAQAEELAPPDEPLADYGFDFGSFFTVIVALVLVIGLILLTVRLLAKGRTVLASGTVRNLGGVMVGQNKSVQLLQIGNSVYIIGVGENVTLLGKIERKEEMDALLQALHNPASLPGDGLLSYVRRWRKGGADAVSQPDNAETGAPSFHEIFHGKMKQIEQRRKRLKDMLETERPSDGEQS